jgi:hypothetical protein
MVIFYSFPTFSIRLIEFLLNLFNTISSGHKHSCYYQWVGFFLTLFKLLSCFCPKSFIPRLPLFIAPMKCFRNSKNCAICAKKMRYNSCGSNGVWQRNIPSLYKCNASVRETDDLKNFAVRIDEGVIMVGAIVI